MMLRVQRLLCRKSYMHPPQRNLAPVLNGGRERKQSEQHNPRRFGFEGSIVVFLAVGEKLISLTYFSFLIDVIIISIKINPWTLRHDNLCDLFYLRKETLEFKTQTVKCEEKFKEFLEVASSCLFHVWVLHFLSHAHLNRMLIFVERFA